MTIRGSFVKWSVIGAVTALILVVSQSIATGGPAGLLQVGESSSLRPMIEEQLGAVPLTPGRGHDGKIYYALGVDLSGSNVPDIIKDSGYRYRRILYPFTSSIGGLLDGWALLYSMIGVTVISMAVSSGTVAALAVKSNQSAWLALAVVLNPGVWLSVRLLTADTMALALMTLGLFAAFGGTRLALLGFAFSGLSKEAFLSTPFGLAISRHAKDWLNLLIPLSVLLVWMTWLTLGGRNGFTPSGDVGLPFVGIIRASQSWSLLEARELFYLGFALVSVIGGLTYGIIRKSWLRWPILTWTFLALTASDWVWRLGNNAARAFAPISILIVLSHCTPTDHRKVMPKHRLSERSL